MSIKLNVVYNVSGAAVSTLVMLVSIPLFLNAVGDIRYGVLSLIWLLLGYTSLLDFGLSRAASNSIAKNHTGDPAARNSILWTALCFNAGVGLVSALAVFIAARPLLAYLSEVRGSPWNEVWNSLPWLVASIPLATLAGVLNGALSAREKFLTVNIINLISTVSFQLAPLYAAYQFGIELHTIIAAAVIARAVCLLILSAAAFVALPIRSPTFNLRILRVLLRYGSWVMLSNFIAPFLVSIDQLIIGIMLGPGAVAHYSVPYNLATRAQVVPVAVVETLFPRLSQQSRSEAGVLAYQCAQVVCVLMTVLCAPAILLSNPFLAWWISPDFARSADSVAEILLIGVWANGIALVPFYLLQAQGRPDIIARFHLLECLPFFAVLSVGIYLFGLPGAALAWTLRVLLDTFLLYRAAQLHPLNTRLLASCVIVLAAAFLIGRQID